MEKIKNNIKDFFGKNWLKGGIALILLFALWSPVKDISTYLAQDQIKDIVTFVIAESVKEDLEKSAVSYSLKLLELEMKEVRDPEEVDDRVKFWFLNKWNAQIAALKVISTSPYARRELKSRVYNEQVYKALISYAR